MDRTTTACFSGYRPEKFSFLLLDGREPYLKLEAKIRDEIKRAAAEGYLNFMCGMAKGFDLICGSLLAELKRTDPAWRDARLIAVPPYREHGFTGQWGIMHDLVMARADEIVIPTKKHNSHVYHLRNRFMVDHSSRLICFYDGQPGGTAYTVDYARKKRVEIVNLKDGD